MQCSLFYVEYEHRFQLAMMNGICFCISIKKPRKIKAWTLYTLYKYGDCAPRAHPARAATRKTLCIIGNTSRYAGRYQWKFAVTDSILCLWYNTLTFERYSRLNKWQSIMKLTSNQSYYVMDGKTSLRLHSREGWRGEVADMMLSSHSTAIRRPHIRLPP